MRLVPWGQMLAEVQASGLTPISWLRFSSRTALTTTCTASNIRAADSWGGVEEGGEVWERGSLAKRSPKYPYGVTPNLWTALLTGMAQGGGRGPGVFPGTQHTEDSGEDVRVTRTSVGLAPPDYVCRKTMSGEAQDTEKLLQNQGYI